MTTNIDNKLMKLLEEHVPETVLMASWLEKQGFSYNLQKYYRQSGWLESIGTGAFIRPNKPIHWQGALYALQTQAKLSTHVGGLTALSLHGMSHYFRLTDETIQLFSLPKTKLPEWFKKYNWKTIVKNYNTSIFQTKLGLVQFEEKNFSITISSPERAILECLYLAPAKIDLVECFQIMEGLTNLRPKLMQELLECCKSVKVKRLFLYMADKARHQWLSFIDQSNISLGKGDRSIVKGGIYISEYHISVPEKLFEL